ncbi:unnamed protein product [Cunninghamella echinulata]
MSCLICSVVGNVKGGGGVVVAAARAAAAEQDAAGFNKTLLNGEDGKSKGGGDECSNFGDNKSGNKSIGSPLIE